MQKGKPFVKWAGGKRQIIDKLKLYLPEKYNVYYEVFLGGGALLFELSPKKAVINDYNEELMNVYKCIQEETKYKKLCLELKKYEQKHSKDFYYEMRNIDKDKEKYKKMIDYKRGARTIYLNNACFNGLYRVNSKNEFNVPFNGKEKIHTYDEENLKNVHQYLKDNDIKIESVDFAKVLVNATEGDFIYLDPPYDSDTTTFNGYTEDGFGKEEQVRLFYIYQQLANKGCYVMMSNHNTKLIRELYAKYNIHIIQAKRFINANGKKRGEVEEVIITNYE